MGVHLWLEMDWRKLEEWPGTKGTAVKGHCVCPAWSNSSVTLGLLSGLPCALDAMAFDFTIPIMVLLQHARLPANQQCGDGFLEDQNTPMTTGHHSIAS